jgi:hypothetical protein
MISSKHQHPVRECLLVKISIGETFLDHPVLFSQNRFFNEASVISSQGCPGMPQTQFLWRFISYLARRSWLSSLSPVRNARFEGLNSN